MPRPIRQLIASAAQSAREMRARLAQREVIETGKEIHPVPHTAVITGFSPNGFTFFGEFRDENGDPIGIPFTIYALSGPAIGGLMGQHDLRDCDPKRVVGDRINIQYKIQEVDDGVTIEGWWAVADFTLFGCETSDCAEI